MSNNSINSGKFGIVYNAEMISTEEYITMSENKYTLKLKTLKKFIEDVLAVKECTLQNKRARRDSSGAESCIRISRGQWPKTHFQILKYLNKLNLPNMYQQFIPAEFNHLGWKDGHWTSSYVVQFKEIRDLIDDKSTEDKLKELNKLKVNTHDEHEQDKKAWQDICNSYNNIVDIIRTAVGIDKIYYDKKIKETGYMIDDYRTFSINGGVTSETYEDLFNTYEDLFNNIDFNLNFLHTNTNYNLKLVVEVYEDKYKEGYVKYKEGYVKGEVHYNVKGEVHYNNSPTKVVLVLLNNILKAHKTDEANKKALKFAISCIKKKWKDTEDTKKLQIEWDKIME